MTIRRVLLGLCLAVSSLAACSDGGAGATSGSAAASGSAKAKTSTTPAGSAVASAVASGSAAADAGGCPEGTTGKGTIQEPCTASDAEARAVDLTYTGDVKGEKTTFKFVNKTDKPILHFDLRVYFYDKDKKQLKVTTPGMKEPRDYWYTSGMALGLNTQLDAKATKESDILGFTKELIPAGTETIQAEVWMTGEPPCPAAPCKQYWANPKIKPDQRPMK